MAEGDATSGAAAAEKVALSSEEQEILDQVEFYFSDSNFRRDKYLRSLSEQDAQGYVGISELLRFNRLKALTSDAAQVGRVLAASSRLQLSEDGSRVRRTRPLPAVDDSKDRTVYVKGIPKSCRLDDIFAWLRSLGVRSQVARVVMRRAKNKAFKGSAFLEFHDRKDAEELVRRHNGADSGLNADLSLKRGGNVEWTGEGEETAGEKGGEKGGEGKEGEEKGEETGGGAAGGGEGGQGEAKKPRGLAILMRNEYYAHKREERRKAKLVAKAKAGESAAVAELEFKKDMEPGVIVKLTKLPDSVEWPSIERACAMVAAVHFTELDAEEEDAAFVRMKEPSGAAALVRAIGVLREAEQKRVEAETKAQEASEDKPAAEERSAVQQALWEAFGNSAPDARVLEGADEREYWERIWAAQLARVKDRASKKAGQKRRREAAAPKDAEAAKDTTKDDDDDAVLPPPAKRAAPGEETPADGEGACAEA